ncbi:MAG: TrpB-like pyridoxal-phosphate dependent enzyme [Candidatus Raymondbacteria bacterium RifOxyA12_full_50_37]|uniref:Tryptophan synthase beta chain n=1 Tax=Candidatus Raymondbacteria bacterium RIFOXYD12_FULL_49_13 TaxID=1817890 RepID=A0A1F7FAI2_UNCRA|nr:MAG: TrpB-like pyridoxal-phosphate dependent enzyme [Candidatus Raymondbacteria bacterium RifOxyA12_full_50_37]OGJ92398.1 MAG: TrpB-like pyridoxal-phosphate dependent enzyme [Candidatus Raymondbacteria bacterium RIFOXYA2_FULL_49_16]OGJ99379.1 MAG: TrpB-like pyridoxal-phosphate dependent enzyme [Candidatus Raymondbacteria bacterium RIFOXYC2_FULL_50_21]OGK03081.1 MAG: TrpB-like pyridoxal-phosphate dependent enzyme [Candidatus Raymondbacteria bacterium RifOxyC12_full_50_8]OGK03608.1 MAG: TrpB-l
MISRKILLKDEDIPRQWYNLAADLPTPMDPPLGPDGKPIGPEMLAPVFPMNLIEQEVSQQRWIDIPEEILDILYRWRPAPLRRAVYLERFLKTPAKIYYKDESTSPPGSHKPNTAVAQAWYNKQFGIKRLTTETGAGQWGSALSFACKLIGLECKVFMVRISFDQKPFRKIMMQVWGGKCIASPSNETNAGREILQKMPDTPGSLGIAISEAIEAAVTDSSGKTRYSLGSVLNHVLLHQTIIGLEAKKQLQMIGEKLPDIIIGCAGGGSNFAGISFPFVYDKINGKKIEIYPVEPAACPSLTKGPFVYDHGDTAKMTPLLPMHSLGHDFVPQPIHAGGLRYHGMAPLVSRAVHEGLLTPKAYPQLQCYEAAMTWVGTEGTICAPETSHAIACVIEEAVKAREEGKEKVILFNYSGHGLMDLSGYDSYLSGKLTNLELPQDEIDRMTAIFASMPKPNQGKTGKW